MLTIVNALKKEEPIGKDEEKKETENVKSQESANSLNMSNSLKNEHDHEFEESRRCLLNAYHTDIQTHVGLLIAIIIGGLALISSWKSFFLEGFWYIPALIIFFGLLILLTLFLAFMFFRIVYWAMFVNFVMIIPMSLVVDYFTKYNSKNPTYFGGETSYMNMLQLAITHTIYEIKKGKIKNPKLNPFQIIALCVSRTKDPDEAKA